MTDDVVASGGPPLLVLVTGLPGTGKSSVAAAVSQHLQAAVLSHDWVMSGLRPFPEIQAALNSIEPSGHRAVGWSILAALAKAQLRDSRSVILDGAARSSEVSQCRAVTEVEGGGFILIGTCCGDQELHLSSR